MQKLKAALSYDRLLFCLIKSVADFFQSLLCKINGLYNMRYEFLVDVYLEYVW